MKPLKRFSPLEGARMLKRAMALLGMGLFVSIASLAQFDLGSVVGTVRDRSGLPMPNATVEIKSLATNLTRQTVISAAGDFDFVALPPGQYALTAKQTGFKETTQT